MNEEGEEAQFQSSKRQRKDKTDLFPVFCLLDYFFVGSVLDYSRAVLN